MRRSLKTLLVVGVAGAALVTVVVVILVYYQRYQVFVMPTADMVPTIPKDSRILVEVVDEPRIELFRYGDILAFRSPRDPSVLYVKRVVGIPGDQVKIVSKTFSRNGEVQEEPYVTITDQAFTTPSGRLDWLDNMDELRIPQRHVFLMGDNRDRSADSRLYGPVPVENVYGRVIQILE